ncbi:MAG: hypothetical protein KBT00_05345 [Bacteroidales bacterium]|nr:hypothetical protein [Candidatus Cacconaster merdequi]
MILTEDLNEEVKNEFLKLGIENIDDMLSICNGLDAIAEIGYTIYNNNRFNDLKNDKETKEVFDERGKDNCKAA